MDYYEGLIKKTEFLTTAELAEKLKMNVQVITRKVQSGEIEAYKLGKDWRIPEFAVFAWLETHSNKNKPSKKNEMKKIVHSIDLKELQSQPTKRKFLLEYILAQFEPNKEYSETDVNRIINKFHADHLAVRSEFISENMMEQVNDKYKRKLEYRMADY